MRSKKRHGKFKSMVRSAPTFSFTLSVIVDQIRDSRAFPFSPDVDQSAEAESGLREDDEVDQHSGGSLDHPNLPVRSFDQLTPNLFERCSNDCTNQARKK